MKRFSFRLDSILRYKSHLEKMAQRDLFKAMNRVIEIEKTIKGLGEKRIETARECSDEGFKGMNVPEYQMYRSFLQKLEHDLERSHIRLKEGEEKVKAKKAALRRASIKKKTLEVLKDLRHKEYMTRLEREEQKVMDELVLIRKGGRT